LEVAGVGRDDPIPYAGLREKYLGECKFQGQETRKIQFAILASASARGGIQPDLLEEVAWWQADDFCHHCSRRTIGRHDGCIVVAPRHHATDRAARSPRSGRDCWFST
jgi:hypothetical protein